MSLYSASVLLYKEKDRSMCQIHMHFTMSACLNFLRSTRKIKIKRTNALLEKQKHLDRLPVNSEKVIATTVQYTSL